MVFRLALHSMMNCYRTVPTILLLKATFPFIEQAPESAITVYVDAAVQIIKFIYLLLPEILNPVANVSRQQHGNMKYQTGIIDMSN